MRNALIVGLTLVATLAAAQVWDVRQNEDIMSGTKNTVLINMAEVSQSTLRDAALLFRFEDGEVEAFVHWGGYSMESGVKMLVKYGDAPPVRVDVTLSTSRDAVFFRNGRAVLDELIALGPDGKVVMQAERNTGVMSAARWIVGDLAEKAAGQ